MTDNNIKTLGPGIWYIIHTLAFNAVNNSKKEAYIIMINSLCDNFICDICKIHFKKFIDNYDLKKYWHIKNHDNDIGFFKWSWELHNSVNIKINKPILKFDEAYKLYQNNTCQNCEISNQRPKILIPITNEKSSLTISSR
jgi:hypothetical protein